MTEKEYQVVIDAYAEMLENKESENQILRNHIESLITLIRLQGSKYNYMATETTLKGLIERNETYKRNIK